MKCLPVALAISISIAAANKPTSQERLATIARQDSGKIENKRCFYERENENQIPSEIPQAHNRHLVIFDIVLFGDFRAGGNAAIRWQLGITPKNASAGLVR